MPRPNAMGRPKPKIEDPMGKLKRLFCYIFKNYGPHCVFVYSYVWGGSSPSTGFDYSGLMYYVLTQYGYSMKRVANDQMTQGTYVSRSDLQVGDLVFFGYSGYANHVGMYIGGGNFVHASTPSTGVRVNSLDESYYKTRSFAGGALSDDQIMTYRPPVC